MFEELIDKLFNRDFFYALLSGSMGFFLTRNTLLKALEGTVVTTSTVESFMFYVYGGAGIVLIVTSALFVKDCFSQ